MSVNSSNLLARARRSIIAGKRAKDADLRRSVSDAYYAVFHHLCKICADALLNEKLSNAILSERYVAWTRIYRAVGHSSAKSALARVASHKPLDEIKKPSDEIKRLATAFADLQEARESADYNPSRIITGKGQVLAKIATAESAIADLNSLPRKIVLEIITEIITPKRR